MKRHIVAGLVPLPAQAAFAAQPVVAGAAGVAAPEPRLSRPQLSREQTPVVLNRTMVACATASRWDAAVFLFAPGGVYGAYDAALANGGLRPDFDAAKGWDAAVAGYLQCSRDSR